MSFMKRQITGKQTWVKVETTHGTEFINVADTSLFVRDSHTQTHPMTDAQRADAIKRIQQYTEGTPQEWETIKGYGARLSAPGYLDCTEWCVFDTVAEAEAYLSDMYGDDEEEDTDED
jgi:hypothetical protein